MPSQLIKSVVGILLSCTLVFSAGTTECTFNSGTGKWSGCTSKYNLFSASCAQGTSCTKINEDTTEFDKFLFECSDSTTCKVVDKSGYYISNGEVFTCKDNTGIKCIRTTKLKTTCNKPEDIGNILAKGSPVTYYLCANVVDGEGLLVSLAAANNGRYAVGASTTSTSILGVTAGTKYGLVTVEVTNETGKNNGISVVGYSASPAEALPSCTYTPGDEGSTGTCSIVVINNNYCISDGNVIYKGTDSAADNKKCAPVFDGKYDNGIMAFSIDSDGKATKLDTSQKKTLTNPNIVLYECAFGQCQKTYGYVYDGASTFIITSKGTGKVLSVPTCTVDTVGEVNYDSNGIKLCVYDDITVTTENDDVAVNELTVFKSFTTTDLFLIKPQATPGNGYFAGDKSYFNLGLIKTQANVAAFSLNNPKLPECDTDATNKVGGTTVPSDYFCISSDGKIYKGGVTAAAYGDTGSTAGIYIFQRKLGSNLGANGYIEVTNTLSSLTKNTEELFPQLVIYDCSTSGCDQTSGFVKYKEGDIDRFINCYYEPANIGCVRLIHDETFDKLCTEESTKATFGTYKYSKEHHRFALCVNLYKGYYGSNAGTENYAFAEMNIGSNGQFVIKNGLTPFPNASTGDVIFVSITSDYAVMRNTVAAGYYVSSGFVYGSNSGEDVLIQCTGTTQATCKYVDLTVEATTTNPIYYINAGPDKANKPLIECHRKECYTVNPPKGYYLNGAETDDNDKFIEWDGSALKASPYTSLSDTSCDCSSVGIMCKSNEYYHFCKSTTATKSEKVIGDEIKYLTVTVEANKFPGVATAGTINVKLAKTSVQLMEEDTLPTCDANGTASTAACKANSETVANCIKEKKIYSTSIKADGTQTCGLLTASATSATVFFNDNDYYRIDFPVSTGTYPNLMAYQCTFTESGTTFTQTGCQLLHGYTLSGRKPIYCSGWRWDKCEVIEIPGNDACSVGVGEYKKLGSLCFGTKEVKLPIGSNKVKTIAFKLNAANEIYGKGEGDVVFLSISSQFVMVADAPTGAADKIYFNQLGIADGSDSLIVYKTTPKPQWDTDAIKSREATDDDNKKTVYAYIDSGDPDKKSVITCGTNGETPAYNDIAESLTYRNKYYVLDTDQSKIIVCTLSDGCKTEAVTATQISGVYALMDGSDENSVIQCSTNQNVITCTSKKGGTNNFIDAKDQSKIIACNTYCQSSKGSTAPGEAYLDTSTTNSKNVLICGSTNSICTLTDAKDMATGYAYINAKENNKVIKDCNGATGCESGDPSGVYIDAIDNTRTIQCQENRCISIKSLTPCLSTVAVSSTDACKYGTGTGTALPANGICINTSDNKIYVTGSNGSSCALNSKSDYIVVEKSDGIYLNSKFGAVTYGLIYTCASNVCSQIMSSYHLHIDGKNNYIYHCNYDGLCVFENVVREGYYLSGVPTIIDGYGNMIYESLIHCQKDEKSDEITCENISGDKIKDNYYVSAVPGMVIYCSDSQCHSVASNSNAGVVYISAEDNKSVIRCEDNGVCSSSDVCTDLAAGVSKYYIDDSDGKKLITCTSSGCVKADNNILGIYVSTLDPNDMIYCEKGRPCKVYQECHIDTGKGCKEDTYYLIQGKTASSPTAIKDGYLLEKGTTNDGFLYYCQSGKCKPVSAVGYYLNSEHDIFECSSVDAVLKTAICKRSTSLTNCRSQTKGKLCITDLDEIKIYLDAGKFGLLDPAVTSPDYYLFNDNNNIPFLKNNSGVAKNFILAVDKKSVTVGLQYNYNNDYFIYTYPPTLRIMKENTCLADIFMAHEIEEYTCTPNDAKCSIPSPAT